MLPSHLILGEGDEKGERESLLRHSRPLCRYRYILSREMHAIYILDVQYKTRKLYAVVSRTRKSCVSVGILFNIVAFNIDVYMMHITKLYEMVEGFALLKFRRDFSKILRFLCTLFASETLKKKKKKNVNGKL